jgi:signal transduction histidine kinase
VQTIRRGAERMTGLVSQMLDFSRLEAGRMELVAGPIDVRTIVAQVRQEIAPLAAAKGLELNISCAPDLTPVTGDAVGVEQILLNLVGNTIKFTAHGSVQITAAAREDAVAVTISDTGIGISADALPHIFEEFRQVEGGMTRRHEGAGPGDRQAAGGANGWLHSGGELPGGRLELHAAPAGTPNRPRQFRMS